MTELLEMMTEITRTQAETVGYLQSKTERIQQVKDQLQAERVADNG